MDLKEIEAEADKALDQLRDAGATETGHLRNKLAALGSAAQIKAVLAHQKRTEEQGVVRAVRDAYRAQ